MPRKKCNPLIPIARSTIEVTAQILGPNSASAKALKEAEEYGGLSFFYQSGNSIILQKLK